MPIGAPTPSVAITVNTASATAWLAAAGAGLGDRRRGADHQQQVLGLIADSATPIPADLAG